MFNKLKAYFKRYQSLVALYETAVKQKNNTINELSYVREFLRKTQKKVDTLYGFTLRGSGSIHHLGMQQGTFEEEETTLMREYLNQSDVFIDAGANIGFYSCLARSMGKQVIAVEPLSPNLTYLYRNLIDNGWEDVEVFPLGLNDQPGLAVLYGASSTGASLISNWAGSSKRFKRVISLSTLDILLGNRFAGKHLFIKIDVEGVEYQVLMGAIKTIGLAPRPTWIIEICLNEFHPTGINPNYVATFELFWKNGYEARTADRYRRCVHPADVHRWAQAGRCDSGVINYIFIPIANKDITQNADR